MLKKNQYKQKNIVIINNADTTMDASNMNLTNQNPVGILQPPQKRGKKQFKELSNEYPYPYNGLL